GWSGTPRSAGAGPSHAPWPARAVDGVGVWWVWWPGSRALAHLAGHVLALVADSLSLVGLGRPPLADVGRDLAHELLGDPPDDDPGGRGDVEVDSVGGLDRDRVREAERQLQVVAALLSAIAHALDLQRL